MRAFNRQRSTGATRNAGRGRREITLKQRQEESAKRNEAWRKLAPAQQLKELDGRRGKSARQRKRLGQEDKE